VHHIISFSLHAICCSDLYHLFGLTTMTPFYDDFEELNFGCNFIFI
jgi:hypothetical protein